jgi:hypothetical protein
MFKVCAAFERIPEKRRKLSRPGHCRKPIVCRNTVSAQALLAVPKSKRTKLTPPNNVSPLMSSPREQLKAANLDMDRQIIRVDIPPAHAGITAALRRAFEAAAAEPCDRDFAELLRQLN